MTVAQSAAVIGDLRKARRKQRVAAIHWVDALYQVYVTGLVAIVAVVVISGFVGDKKVSVATLVDVHHYGPSVMGLFAAFAVLMGLRSGARGGPLALEQADVRHVLLSPVDRGVALRGPAWRQLRFLVFASAGVGAAAGQLALRRLPGNPAEWILGGALFGVVVVGLGFGSALIAAGIKLPGWAATLIGVVLVGWSAAEVANRVSVAPATVVGHLAVLPLGASPLGIIGVVAAVAAVGAGMRIVAGTSLEGAERRTALVGQLRFAVTLQDLRTVLVLRRQLAQERPRSRPWIPARSGRPRFPVFYRGVRSLLRWPVSRLIRVVGLAVGAGYALRGVWGGTTPLVLLAGLLLWIAALDAVEPLGQEIDHPGRTDSFPLERDELFFAHLPVVAIVSGLVGGLAGAIAGLPIGQHPSLAYSIPIGIVAGLMAGAGAVVSVIQGAPDAVDVLAITTPEIAGMRTVTRTAWPPGLAVIGTLPLLAARAAALGASNPPPLTAASFVMLPIAGVLALVAGWVRFHDQIHEAIRQAADQMSPTKALERQQAEREELEARHPGPLVPVGLDDDGQPLASTGAPSAKPKARPKTAPPKPKPPAPKIDPIPGIQGGKSPKPMGRRRDQT